MHPSSTVTTVVGPSLQSVLPFVTRLLSFASLHCSTIYMKFVIELLMGTVYVTTPSLPPPLTSNIIAGTVQSVVGTIIIIFLVSQK